MGLTFNFDDYGSDEVRKFILENVRYWFEVFKIDGLRLDAVHAIFDMSPKHILEEISELADSLRKLYLIEIVRRTPINIFFRIYFSNNPHNSLNYS